MGYFVAPIQKPYDVASLINVYRYVRRTDFVHEDFHTYYQSLLAALQQRFGVSLAREGLSFRQQVLWNLFENTVDSSLRIVSPWDSYLDASLLAQTLDASGELGVRVYRASDQIQESNAASVRAHDAMLHALFDAIFGHVIIVVTSEDLAVDGFDDSHEPNISDYYDLM